MVIDQSGPMVKRVAHSGSDNKLEQKVNPMVKRMTLLELWQITLRMNHGVMVKLR